MKIANNLSGAKNKPVEKWCKSKMGYDFDFNFDLWQLDGSTRINLARLRELDEDASVGIRMALCRYAEELSGATVDSVIGYFNMYCDATQARRVTVNDLANWRATLAREHEHRLGMLKSFLFAWHEWRFPGIDPDVEEYLESLVLRGIVKGKAVKGMCQFSGPFTLAEQGALIDWASNAFIKREIDLTKYSMFLALSFTGRRLVQIRSLRACDLIAKQNNEGTHSYSLKVPRVKQPGLGFRESFRSLPIVNDLYSVLRAQIKENREFIESHFNLKITDQTAQQVPIFLDVLRVRKIKSLQEFIKELEKRPDYLHMSRSKSLDTMRAVRIACTARSERTGDFIIITSRRFRYTKGTNLSRRGIQGVVLAEALDHTDTQHVPIYAANTVEVVQHINEVMAPALAPLAQAFAGQLIASERDAIRASDPHSRIKNSSAQNIGNCGGFSFCVSGYRACYTCINYQAWIDGPHSEVRDEILLERVEQENAGVSTFVIQSTDRLLMAVEQVIHLCLQAKAAENVIVVEKSNV